MMTVDQRLAPNAPSARGHVLAASTLMTKSAMMKAAV